MEPKLEKQLNTIQTRLQLISDLKSHYLNENKFRELKGRKKSDQHKDYEVKTKFLRVYFFKDNIGRIIVMGGTKSTQKSDIRRMRKIKQQYFKEKTT